MVDESSDILGSQYLHSAPGDHGTWGLFSPLFKTSSILSLGLVAFLTFAFLKDKFKRWQERRYKKATRRRHGIPDHDLRPFPVAFQAARNLAEAARSSNTRRNALAEAQNIRQRNENGPQGNATADISMYPNSAIIAGPSRRADDNTYNWYSRQTQPSMHSVDIRKAPSQIRITEPSPLPQTSRRASKKDLYISPCHSSKRALDVDGTPGYEPDVGSAKKTKVEGEEFIDGDEDAVWHKSENKPEIRSESDARQKRGSKRTVEDDGASELTQISKRDKRQRKVSRDHTPEDEVDVPEEEADELMELDESYTAKVRGKKRDRAEAGSTFGGDDEDESFDHEDRNMRRRKRRTVSKRKSDAASRGRKRDRDAESESDGEESREVVQNNQNTKKKGKKAKASLDREEANGEGDASMDSSDVSQDPLCKGRRIGEEWELNGIQYKVGPNGDRLRQVLVKKARSKFVMPKDSQHPDKQANLEVYVETWLTEDQYNEAKERHELAWQDSPQTSVEPETPADPPESPAKGKNLLWSSTSTSNIAPQSPAPHSKRGPFRQSIATNLGMRINPFQAEQRVPGRRISFAYSGYLPESSNGTRAFKSFSKWEKQDLEAEAMARMRKKLAEQKKAEKQLPTSVSAPASVGSTPAPAGKPADTKVAPTITFTLPSSGQTNGDNSSPAAVPPLFAPPSAPVSSQPPTTSQADKAKPPPLFSWPSTSTTPTVSTATDTAKSSIPALAPTTPAPAPSPFLFAQPPAKPSAPLSSNTAPSSSTSAVPNFFSQPPASSTAATPVSTNLFGGASTTPSSTPTASAANPVPKSTFSFPPSTAASSAPTFNFSAPASKTPASVFGGATEQKPAQGTSGKNESSSSSLLGRVGGFTAPATESQPQSTFKAPSIFGKPASSEPPKPAPTISFGTTPTSQAQPLSFSNLASSSNPVSSSNPTSSSNPAPSSNGAIKFNFGFANKASSTAPSPSPGPMSTNSSTAVPPESSASKEAPKPAESAFGFSAPKSSGAFGTNTGASSTTSAGNGTSTFTPPKSSFDAPSSTIFGSTNNATQGNTRATFSAPSGSVFGSSNDAAQGSPMATTSLFAPAKDVSTATSSAFTPAKDPSSATTSAFTPATVATPKSTFGTLGGGNAFSTTPAGSPSIFGSSSNTNAADAPKTAFSFAPSASTTKPGEPEKPTFSFGNAASGSSTASKPAFSLSSAPTTSTTPASSFGDTQNKTGFSFSFGQPSQPAASSSGMQSSNLFGGQSTGAAPIFGKPSTATPNTFGFSNTPTTPNFGGSSSGQNQQQ